MSTHAQWVAIVLAIHAAINAADNPRHIDLGPGLTAAKSLPQNWTDDEAGWFYNVAQGSRLVPYDWFLCLEQANSQEPFRDAKHIRALGYIPRTPDPKNPDGLPIGFIKDAPYEDGMAGLGMTCAACHTSQINHKGAAFLIDGGPGMGDLERLLKELAAALQATADDDAKFDRFAAAVLPAGIPANVKASLRASVRSIALVRQQYNDRDLPKLDRDHFGPGRVDAFGAILNEVTVTFLDMPQNWSAASAPVSYPCLWDAPQHDRVQWNGAAENRVTPLGAILFGTAEVGALGRNSGEVLGVFGSADINAHEFLIPRRYASTINKANLIPIEASLKKLWSPLWPRDALGPIDADLCAKGAALFQANCAKCHDPINRTDPNRKVVARLSDEGTDPSMIRNFGRTVNTGRLKGRQKTLTGLERFAQVEPRGVILKHVVERVMLGVDPIQNANTFREALAQIANQFKDKRLDALDALNPGYQMTATIEVGDQQLVGQFDSLAREGPSVAVGGGHFDLRAKGSSERGGQPVDLRSPESVKAEAARLGGVIKVQVSNVAASAHEQFKALLNNATVKIGYKARPLNGVWATAPYLHNGSVPSLAELLKPAAERVKQFHVGSQEYDPENVGFKDDPSQPLFDTTVDGNSNAGHEYGGKLSVEERRQLLEYLKSL